MNWRRDEAPNDEQPYFTGVILTIELLGTHLSEKKKNMTII